MVTVMLPRVLNISPFCKESILSNARDTLLLVRRYAPHLFADAPFMSGYNALKLTLVFGFLK